MQLQSLNVKYDPVLDLFWKASKAVANNKLHKVLHMHKLIGCNTFENYFFKLTTSVLVSQRNTFLRHLFEESREFKHVEGI